MYRPGCIARLVLVAAVALLHSAAVSADGGGDQVVPRTGWAALRRGGVECDERLLIICQVWSLPHTGAARSCCDGEIEDRSKAPQGRA